MDISEFEKLKETFKGCFTETVRRTSAEYAEMFLEKFVYFFDNSDILFNLILNPESEVSITRIDQLLFQDKDLLKCQIYKIVEDEKTTFNVPKRNTFDNKMKYMTLITNAIYEYLIYAIEQSFDYNDEEYENMLEIKRQYLDNIVTTQNNIRTSPQMGDYFYLNDHYFTNASEKYDLLIDSLGKKSLIWGNLKPNKFISAIYNNESIIFNKAFQDKIMTSIILLANGINVYNENKIMVRK